MTEKLSPYELERIELDGIMRQDSGRKLLGRLLDRFGYHQGTYDDDPRRHAFNEGRRSAAIELYGMMKDASPSQLNNILKEYNDGN